MALAAASLIWTLIAIHASPGLSRYDEWTYIDYADQISRGHLPAPGDDLGELARTAWSCRGMEGDIRGVEPPPCEEAAAADPASWPFRGENYNAFHPPLYFAFAGGIARALAPLGVDFVDGARLASGLLAAAGAAALFFAVGSWGIGRRLSAGVTLLALSTPALAQAGAIVHNDAADLLAVAGAIWLAGRLFRDGRMPVGRMATWAFALAFLIGSVRTISLVALIVVGAIAAGRALSGRREIAPVPLAIAAGAAASYLPWAVIQRLRTPDGYVPDISGLSTEPLTASKIPAFLATFIGSRAPYGLTSPRTDYYLHPDLTSPMLTAWAWALMIACYGAVIVAAVALVRRISDPERFFAWVIILGPLIAALIVQGRELALGGSFFRMLSGRYAITLAPLYYVGFALWARRWRAQWWLVGAGALGYLLVLSGPLVS